MMIDDNTIPIAIDTAGDAFGVRPLGNEAWVADFDGGMAVLDLLTEQQVDSFGAGMALAGAVDIELNQGRAIVATGPGLRIVEDDPQTGFELAGFYDSGNEATGASQDAEVIQDGETTTLVYLARWLDGLDVLDVTDPANITVLANIPTGDGTYEVSYSGFRAVTAEGNDGIGVLDIGDPSSPISLGSFPSEGFTADVELGDTFAFVAFDTDSGLCQGGVRIVRLERIGVDPMLVPEPSHALRTLLALMTGGALASRRRKRRR